MVVQKYGGTSVADPSRIRKVADRVVATRAGGNDVVVVVSAMGQTTDTLQALAAEVTDSPPPREMDMLLTAGERISMALLAMALHARDVPAVSFTGSQAGILTDASHGSARITRITGERVREALEEKRVVIVAGFQGVDPQSKEVTTLGRGGSDTTAVALAATLDAQACEILTDVDGVFTADPRRVPEAVKIPEIRHDQMLAMARAGAGVLMADSVAFAAENDVTVHVRSSFHEGPGTLVSRTAPALGFAGMAVETSGPQPQLSIIGSTVTSRAESLIGILETHGLAAELVDSKTGEVELAIDEERVDETLRFLHQHLLIKEPVS